VSIGEALTRARTQAGLTVTQVSDQTRIRETVITGIEGDDFSACGGELYVRGYIRSIARAAGADPEPLIREYEAAQLGPQAMPDEADEPVTPIMMHERRLPGWIALGYRSVWYRPRHERRQRGRGSRAMLPCQAVSRAGARACPRVARGGSVIVGPGSRACLQERAGRPPGSPCSPPTG
jgi:transcriptional regulator with XRE-family HTH domain